MDSPTLETSLQTMARGGQRLPLVFLMAGLCSLLVWPCHTAAQPPNVHYFHSANLPPGTVAGGQLLRDPLLRGYVQPVEIQLPEGVRASVNIGGQFDQPRPGPVRVGMLIGPVYQFKISHIPFHEGMEVYPTIELINRLYPPPGQAAGFPVPVQLTTEELNYALDGRYVTRVIYLEDIETALPARDDPAHQRYYEVPPGQDPLLAADRMGRPMAILRMGSRIPDEEECIQNCPPLLDMNDVPAAPAAAPGPAGVERAIERQERDVPRVFFPRRSAFQANSPGAPEAR